MKTISVTADDMESRIARFADLTPLEAQKKTHMPQEAADIVWSRRLMSVIRLDEGLDTPINAAAPITGAATQPPVAYPEVSLVPFASSSMARTTYLGLCMGRRR